MASDAQFIGIEEVVQAFDRLAKTPFYSVTKGKDILFQNNENNMEVAKSVLVDNLSAGEANGNRDMLKLRFHPKVEKGGFITEKTPAYSTIYFRICPPEYSMAEYRNLNNNYRVGAVIRPEENNSMLQKISDTLSGINQRLTTLEHGDIIDDDEITKAERITDLVGGIIDHPVVAAIVSKTLGIDIQPRQSVAALSGLPPQDQLQQAVNRLYMHDPLLHEDLERLANIADKNKSQFEFLINTLRSMA